MQRLKQINGYSFEIGGEVGPSLPRHKSLGTNPSVYKHQIPAKTRGLQEASANSRRDAKNRATSALQEGCPTHMANLKEPSIIQLDFSLSFLQRILCSQEIGSLRTLGILQRKKALLYKSFFILVSATCRGAVRLWTTKFLYYSNLYAICVLIQPALSFQVCTTKKTMHLKFKS